MKSILTTIFCLLVFSSALADSFRKFDEYGNIPFSDEMARLDNLAIHLKQEPDLIAWIVVHPGRKDCVDAVRARALKAKNYLVNKRGIQADRIMWKDGGYYEELTIEIWAWPRKVGAPLRDYSALDKQNVQIPKRCKIKSQRGQRRI